MKGKTPENKMLFSKLGKEIKQKVRKYYLVG